MAQAKRDENFVPTLIGVSSSDGQTPINVYVDPVTHRLLVDLASGAGTVTTVSVVTANGFAGTVADPTTTPAITLETTVTGIIKGDGTAMSAAVANTDYQSPISLTTTGSSGAATFDGTTLNIPEYAAGTGVVETVVGTADRITVDSTDPANPIVDIASNYVGQNTITTLGTITTGVWQGTSISTTYTDAKVASITGTAGRITIGGTASVPTVDISATYIGQNTITTLGTITTGVWNGTDIALADGGTGASLSDPGADRILFWDDSAGAVTWLATGVSLSISTTTLNTIQDIRTSATPTFTGANLSSGTTTLGTLAGAIDAGGATSFEIPNSAAPTVNADGEIAVDTSVADFSHGIIKFFGGEEQGVVSMPVAEFTSPQDGDVVTYNATADEFQLQQPTGGRNIQTFDSSTNWDKPSGDYLFAYVEIWGGGGAGASRRTISGGAPFPGGGGGGEYRSFLIPFAIISGSTVAVTVGAGGTAAVSSSSTIAVGGNGGATSFGSFGTANGGTGGGSGMAGAGGTGGSNTGLSIANENGSAGAMFDGTVTNTTNSGAGGGGANNATTSNGGTSVNGGNGGNAVVAGTSAVGQSGAIRGGGGGAAYTNSNTTNATSGAGGGGYCRVTSF